MSAFFRLLFSVSDILSPNHYSLEWWSYEALILLSGLLPNPKTETSVLSIWYASFSLLNSWICSTECL